MSHNITPFTWGDIALNETVFVGGVPHVTKTAIGEWLDYADPRVAVNKIIERNPYLRSHSVDVKLTSTDGKNYDSEVFHPIGFLLIVMESGQPRAQAMKQAVAEFVWHFAGPRTLSRKEEMELLKLRRTLISDLTRTRDAFARQALLSDLREVSLSLGQPLPAETLLGKDVEQLGLQGV